MVVPEDIDSVPASEDDLVEWCLTTALLVRHNDDLMNEVPLPDNLRRPVALGRLRVLRGSKDDDRGRSREIARGHDDGDSDDLYTVLAGEVTSLETVHTRTVAYRTPDPVAVGIPGVLEPADSTAIILPNVVHRWPITIGYND